MRDSSKAMFDYLSEDKRFEVKYLINDKKTFKKLREDFGDKIVSSASFEGKKFMFLANVWLLDGGMPTKNVFYFFNKIIVNFWHGIPIKKVGIEGYRGLNWLRMYLQLRLFSLFVTAYTVPTSRLTGIFATSFLLPHHKIKVLGQPKNDLLLEGPDEVKHQELFAEFKNGERFVLYAPTWRESKYGTGLGSSVSFFPFDDFDIQAFNRFLVRENIVFFMRPHYLEPQTFERMSNIRMVGSDTVTEVSDILPAFDMVISDYSSIYLDFLLLDRPVLLLPYDLEEYRAVKGLNFRFDDINPGPDVSSLSSFQKAVLKLLNMPNYYAKDRTALKTYFHQIPSGSRGAVRAFILEEFNKTK